jgi:conjugative relaxase-like TrwC/TraI family protein
MLRITQQDSSQGAKAYYAAADYYTEGQEIVGLWQGNGARLLGLNGVVDKESFDKLCDNLHPKDGSQLTARTRSDRTVGYDFTFSVPKSVSLLYTLYDDQGILQAFRESVVETMRGIESEMQTRVRKNRRDENRTTGNMVWAEFIHTTSRPVDGVPDPQLHAHCFAFNTTWDEQERQWKAGQFRGLKADAPYFQSAFRVRLANKLQDLGYGISRKRDDFEITGVPAAVIKRFSRRTEEIERVAAEKGITDPNRKAELGATTREKKNDELSWVQLLREWDSRLTDRERQALRATYSRKVPHARAMAGEGPAVEFALEHLSAREPSSPERKVLTEAMKRGLGAVTVEGVARELARRPLIRGLHNGKAMVATWGMKVAEERLIEFGRQGRGKCRPFGNADRPFVHDWLNKGQKAAVRHVLSARDRVMVIRGAAGTGKTTLEDELRLALAEAKVPVVAVAQSTTAVDELKQEAGFKEAATIAHFLLNKKMQAAIKGGLLLVDEASLVGTRDMRQLFDIVSEQGARIALVGDKRQHRSVSAGEPLRLLEERAGLPVAEVDEILRQQDGDYRKAAQYLSKGKSAEGFAELEKKGWIVEIPHAGRYWVMAQGYLSTILEKKKDGTHKTALCVSPTHAEGHRITHFIRGALKGEGKLGEERVFSTWLPAHLTDPQKQDATNYEPGDLLQYHKNAPGQKNGSRRIVAEGEALPLGYADRYEVYRPTTLSLARGDRVRVTVNGWTKDGKHKLKNGTLLTVQGFTPQGDVIVDKGWVIGKEFGHLAHGYVVTSHAAEGRTVDKVFIGESSQSFPATNQRSFYVPVTRGREQAVIFTDDKKELLQAVQRPDTPISATELAERSRQKAPLLQRFRKHFAFIRRRASFVRTHEPHEHEPHQKERSRGIEYGR